jgi:uncharacterized C2H2 Zn-finger protein
MKRKLPEPIIKEDKIFCPNCDKECKSKQSYNMHWFRVHTRNFNKPKKKEKRAYRKRIINDGNTRQPVIIPHITVGQKYSINCCPNCGANIKAAEVGLNMPNNYEQK